MVEASLRALGAKSNVQIETFQSNHEGHLIDRIHAAQDGKTDAIVINPGSYTNTSVAIRDALLGIAIPFIEVHITNIHIQEAFRAHGDLSDKAKGCVIGLGVFWCEAAVQYALKKLVRNE